MKFNLGSFVPFIENRDYSYKNELNNLFKLQQELKLKNNRITELENNVEKLQEHIVFF